MNFAGPLEACVSPHGGVPSGNDESKNPSTKEVMPSGSCESRVASIDRSKAKVCISCSGSPRRAFRREVSYYGGCCPSHDDLGGLLKARFSFLNVGATEV